MKIRNGTVDWRTQPIGQKREPEKFLLTLVMRMSMSRVKPMIYTCPVEEELALDSTAPRLRFVCRRLTAVMFRR